MKKQRIKGIVLVVVCFICVLCICSGFYRVQSKELSEIPDAVNSTRFNTTEHLTVVANQEEIADKGAGKTDCQNVPGKFFPVYKVFL